MRADGTLVTKKLLGQRHSGVRVHDQSQVGGEILTHLGLWLARARGTAEAAGA